MKRSRRHTGIRTFSAIILLMVMLLQVGVKGFHRHHCVETASVTCSDCEHHRVHDGHILNWNGSCDDCIVCQLFSSPFCKPQGIQLNVIPVGYQQPCICFVAAIVDVSRCSIIPRGPPAFLL